MERTVTLARDQVIALEDLPLRLRAGYDAMGSASSIGIAPRAIRWDRSSPSTSSITRACTPADFSTA
jgi:hypothetical protein